MYISQHIKAVMDTIKRAHHYDFPREALLRKNLIKNINTESGYWFHLPIMIIRTDLCSNFTSDRQNCRTDPSTNNTFLYARFMPSFMLKSPISGMNRGDAFSR